ncbi:MAG: hypothetical protein GY835_08290 [bacterium]|nr:hypothetical protein [bacterium]
MRNIMKLSLMVLFLVGIVSGVFANEGGGVDIVLDEGMTFFEANGEEFVVVTTQKLTIHFAVVNDENVFGLLTPSEAIIRDEDQVKFLWLIEGEDPITLFFGRTYGKAVNFDSDITGHNEKGE